MRTDPVGIRGGRRASLLWENVRMALQSLLSTKLRSVLTLLGLMIGVGAVIGMVAVITGLNRSMRDQIAALGSGILYVSKHEAGIRFGDRPLRPRRDLTILDSDAIAAHCPSVSAVSPEIRDMTRLSAGGVRTSSLARMGATPAFQETNEWYVESGRFVTREDVRHRRRVVVLGSAPAEALFPHGGALGQWLEADGQRYQVVGILRSKGQFMGQNMDDLAIFPLPVVARSLRYGDSIDYMTVRPRSPDLVEEARDEITELLRRRRGVRADQPDDFGITSQGELMELYQRVTGAFFLVTLLLSSIGLTVGGIGVMNMMLVSVKERTREIGIRAALGARRRDIMSQFLTEAVTLTLVGGIMGIALGYALAGIIGVLLSVPLAVSVPGIAAALGVSAAVGIFFGLYPAHRASKLDPVEALRYE